MTAEGINKIRAARLGKSPWNKGMSGLKYSPHKRKTCGVKRKILTFIPKRIASIP